MNKKTILIICLLAIIIINLAVSYLFIKEKEGLETQTHAYSNNAKNQTTERGFSSGFAGSGGGIDVSNIDYSGLYGNSTPNANAYSKLTHYDTNNYNVEYLCRVLLVLKTVYLNEPL